MACRRIAWRPRLCSTRLYSGRDWLLFCELLAVVTGSREWQHQLQELQKWREPDYFLLRDACLLMHVNSPPLGLSAVAELPGRQGSRLNPETPVVQLGLALQGSPVGGVAAVAGKDPGVAVAHL